MNIMRVQGKGFDHKPRICKYTELEPALSGADFFAAIREGGLQARCCDEHVVLDLGLVGAGNHWTRRACIRHAQCTGYAADGPCGCQGLS